MNALNGFLTNIDAAASSRERSSLIHPALLEALEWKHEAIPVRRFNDAGNDAIRAFYSAGDGGCIEGRFKGSINMQFPYHLLFDPSLTEVVGHGIEIDLRPLETMGDLASMLTHAFGSRVEMLRNDSGLLNWISALRVDDIYPADPSGSRRMNSPLRYMFRDFDRKAGGFDMGYRHIVWAAVFLAVDHGFYSRMFLTASLSKPGDLIEQVLGRPVVRQSPGLMKALDRMYYDSLAGRLLPGALAVRKGGKANGALRKGGLRDAIDVILQCAYKSNLLTSTPEQILDMVPDNDVFTKYKDWALKAA